MHIMFCEFVLFDVGINFSRTSAGRLSAGGGVGMHLNAHRQSVTRIPGPA